MQDCPQFVCLDPNKLPCNCLRLKSSRITVDGHFHFLKENDSGHFKMFGLIGLSTFCCVPAVVHIQSALILPKDGTVAKHANAIEERMDGTTIGAHDIDNTKFRMEQRVRRMK